MENKTKVRYYIGDLCYVMHDEWDEVCNLLDYEDETVSYELADGRKFHTLFTKYGDGTYLDNFGRSYSVDAGLIGAIRVEDIRDPDFEEVVARGGAHIVEFDTEFQEYDVHEYKGLLCFAHVEIETGDGMWEEDELEDEDEDA